MNTPRHRLDGTDPGTPLLPASGHSPASHPVATPEPPPGPANTPVFSYLHSYCQAAMTSHIRQNYSTEVEAAVSCLASLHLGPPTPTSLWATVSTRKMWLWRAATSSASWRRRSARGTAHLLQLQNKLGGSILCQDVQKPSQDAGRPNSGRHGSCPDPHPFGAAGADPHLCDFLENHFLDEEVKLIKKMGDT
uniref:Ferritin light chain n=1 Tax=Myotis myotis TaxID=51298 RepID=A0A7J7XLJ4_MYOMY|nr:ubiquitin specific peptidase 42 [Myotis myotis]